MRFRTVLGLLLAILCLPLLTVGPASAQATRTWVSGVGDDANPCSRTAPCKTFAGAISKTAASGEINCLDPGGFGAVTITKSITILCEDTIGGVLVSSTNGIVINGAGIVVRLHGLDFDGVGTGLAAIRIYNASAVQIENCQIYGFKAGGANGWAIRTSPSAALDLMVTDTIMFNNGDASSGGGMLVQTANNQAVHVTLTRVQSQNNFFGLVFNGSGGDGGSINADVHDSSSSANSSTGVYAVSPPSGASVMVLLDGVAVSQNGPAAGVAGISANGAPVHVEMGNSSVVGNTVGLATANSASLLSFGNNQIVGNGSPGSAPGSIALQ